MLAAMNILLLIPERSQFSMAVTMKNNETRKFLGM
jgi:hypothetical protein